MSTVEKDRCELFEPTNFVEKVIYNSWIQAAVVFFLAGFWHELGHGIGNGFTGGDFGLQATSGFLGGYDLLNIYFVLPVFMVRFVEYGNRYVMLLAGPLSVILLAWIVGLKWNLKALDGPCGGINKWKRRRGIVWGLLLRGAFDAVYLLPIDVFPDRASDGDGTVLHRMFVNDGYVVEELFGLPWYFSAEHVIGAIAILGTAYVAWTVVKWQIANCSTEFFGECTI